MLIADSLRKENIAEYLLYMWQAEDLLRACGLDAGKLEAALLSSADAETRKEMAVWYSGLADMMRMEGVEKQGHLQVCKNVLIQLTDLHRMLLRSVKYPEYAAAFYGVLPIIVELRAKSGEAKVGELETCFNALYGLMLLRLQKKEVSDETLKATAQISKFISVLASFYHKDKVHPLFDKEDYE